MVAWALLAVIFGVFFGIFLAYNSMERSAKDQTVISWGKKNYLVTEIPRPRTGPTILGGH